MRIVKTIALCLAALALPASGQSPRAPSPAAPLAPVGVTTPAPSAGAQLTATDVDSWLDGLMPYGIESGGIAGAVVVVVKDGKVLTQRGFGKADVKTGKRVDPAAKEVVLDTQDLSIAKAETSADGETWLKAEFKLGASDAVLGAPLSVPLLTSRLLLTLRLVVDTLVV